MIINVLISDVIDNVAIIDMFTSNRHLKVVKMIVNYDNLSKDANHSLGPLCTRRYPKSACPNKYL